VDVGGADFSNAYYHYSTICTIQDDQGATPTYIRSLYHWYAQTGSAWRLRIRVVQYSGSSFSVVNQPHVNCAVYNHMNYLTGGGTFFTCKSPTQCCTRWW